MKDSFFLITGIFLIAWSFYVFLQKPVNRVNQLIIGGKNIVVEIADTDATRAQGLSGRPSLETSHGLMFIFDKPGIYGFWMKDMYFPIDIIWIGKDGKVAGIERSINPDTYPRVFYPPMSIRSVLEVNVNSGIDIGDKVIWDR